MSNVITRRRIAAVSDQAGVAIARLRGAALALTSAAAAVEQYVARAEDCAPDDGDCLTTRYADLLRHRELVRRASDELGRLEANAARAAAAEGQILGWDVPYVRLSRDAIDRANDLVVGALQTSRSALTRVGQDPTAV